MLRPVNPSKRLLPPERPHAITPADFADVEVIVVEGAPGSPAPATAKPSGRTERLNPRIPPG